jgi:hypothetical protein
VTFPNAGHASDFAAELCEPDTRERTEPPLVGSSVPRHEDTTIVTEERPSPAHEVGQPVSELRNACPVHDDVECRPRWACA